MRQSLMNEDWKLSRARVCWLLENEKWTRRRREWEKYLLRLSRAHDTVEIVAGKAGKKRESEQKTQRRENFLRMISFSYCDYSRMISFSILCSWCWIYVGSLSHFTQKKTLLLPDSDANVLRAMMTTEWSLSDIPKLLNYQTIANDDMGKV